MQGRDHGRFHPRNIGINYKSGLPKLNAEDQHSTEFYRAQIKIKTYIIKELYPGIREIQNHDKQTEAVMRMIFGYSSLLQSPQTYDEALPFSTLNAKSHQYQKVMVQTTTSRYLLTSRGLIATIYYKKCIRSQHK
jgi:hypothetical protein